MNASILASAILAACAGLHSARAQSALESDYRMLGPKLLEVFEPQRQVLQSSSAIILDGRDEIACGIVISPGGDILTKASELRGATNLAVTVDRKRYSPVSILSQDDAWDVAHLKIDATGLVPIVCAANSDVPAGTWVVANGVTSRIRRRALAGIISANPREIPAGGGVALGVQLNPKPGKETGPALKITGILDNSGAKDAGLETGDIITAIGGKPVKTPGDLAAAMKKSKAGDRIRVSFLRLSEKMETTVALTTREQIDPKDEMSRNDMMSGVFSERRSGFPRVIQHDILAAKSTVGGPLLDLDGRCLGMNIARANRSESFAIPVEELRQIAVRMLKSDKSAPPPPP